MISGSGRKQWRDKTVIRITYFLRGVSLDKLNTDVRKK